MSNLSFVTCIAQTNKFKLQSESGEIKEFNLSNNPDVSITIPDKIPGKTCCYTRYYGNVFHIDSDSIKIKLRKEVNGSTENGVKSKTTIKYDYQSSRTIALGFENISSIGLRSKTSEKVSKGSAVLFLAGLITTAVIAPLSGIQNEGKGYDTRRFLTVAGIGIAASAVAIPIGYFSRSKQYILKDFKGNEKDVWNVLP